MKTMSKSLKTTLRERDAFLQQHPHLKAFQNEIDTLLDKSGNSKNRLAVLAMMIQGKLVELNQCSANLKSKLSDF